MSSPNLFPIDGASSFSSSVWTAYTPSAIGGEGVATAISFFWRRIGDTMEIMGAMTTGTVQTTLAYFEIPTGYTIDAAKIPRATTNVQPSPLVGLCTANGANNNMALVVCTATDLGKIYCGGLISGAANTTPQNGSVVWGSSMAVFFNAKVPISGWS